MSFGEIVSAFRSAVSGSTAKMALVFCTIMWIGGGMGTDMGVIGSNGNSFRG